MRLHNLIELIPRLGRRGDFGDKVVDGIVSSKEQTIEFDFGNFDNIPNEEFDALADYGHELIKHDMFEFPFDRVSYSYKTAFGDVIAIIQKIDEHKHEIVTYSKMIDNRCFGYAFTHDSKHKIDGNYKSVAKNFYPLHTHHLFDITDRNELAQAVGTMFTVLIVANSLLQSRGVEQRITPAPDFINKKRARKGKPPIGEIREIIIRVGDKIVRPNGETIGSHASPRMHWRRGHIRRLPSGEITNVRPHLVGAIDGAAEPAPKNYAVRRSA